MTAATHVTDILPADAAAVARAVALLDAGQLVAIPTETVYGLAADAADGRAVAGIYAAKGRPSFNPLIVHVADLAMALRLVDLPADGMALAEAFWPGPLTLVAPLRPQAAVSSLVTAGLPTLAVRVPAHPVSQAVIAGLGRGLAAPSANASGRLSPTRAAHVRDSLFGRVPLVLDAGPTVAGLESTILAVSGSEPPVLLRHGAITAERVADFLARPIGEAGEGAAVSAPGMLLRHYAPRLPLTLDVETPEPGAFHIGFGTGGDLDLSPAGDLAEAAARLFDALHLAEASGRHSISIAPIPHHGIGRAINDRLTRAARR